MGQHQLSPVNAGGLWGCREAAGQGRGPGCVTPLLQRHAGRCSERGLGFLAAWAALLALCGEGQGRVGAEMGEISVPHFLLTSTGSPDSGIWHWLPLAMLLCCLSSPSWAYTVDPFNLEETAGTAAALGCQERASLHDHISSLW